jgi:hypothetical protein
MCLARAHEARVWPEIGRTRGTRHGRHGVFFESLHRMRGKGPAEGKGEVPSLTNIMHQNV